MSKSLIQEMAKYWSKEQGGAVGNCPACLRDAYKKIDNEIRKMEESA